MLMIAALAIGVGAAISPRAALAGVVATIALAGVVAARHVPLVSLAAAVVLLTSALVELPRDIKLGPGTGLAWLSIGFVVLALSLLLTSNVTNLKGLGWSVLPSVAFLAWALVSLLFNRPSSAGAQNLIVFATFVLLVLAGAASVRSVPSIVSSWGRLMKVASVVAMVLYCASIALSGFGGHAVLTPRPFALFALVCLAWAIGTWRYVDRTQGVIWAAALVLLIALSLSRAALGSAAVILALGWANPRGFGSWVRTIAIVLGIALAALVVFAKFSAINARFTQGDVKTVAGTVSINTSGRDKYWATTWDSFKTSPIVGHGAGSADELITEVYGPQIGHPHNDYLRILNDYGIIGFVLWIVGYLGLIVRCGKSWMRSSGGEESRLHAAATLALIAVALTMITDNVVIYVFVMAPLGWLAGMSLGVEQTSQRGAAYWDPAPRVADSIGSSHAP
jgi:O-antigen ligase